MTRLIIFIFTSIFCLLIVTIPSNDWVETAFIKSGYYFILVSFILWLIFIFLIKNINYDIFIKKHYQGLLLSIIVSIMIFILSPPQFKVLADETNLLNVSMSMYMDKSSDLPLGGMDYEHSNKIVDKRPILYPFLTSIIHSFMGYKAVNSFVVNFISCICTLFLFYFLLTELFSKRYGLISILIVAGSPIVCFWFTSGGFEPINLTYLMFVFVFLYYFINVESERVFTLLILTALLFSQCRYESIIIFVPLILIIPFCLKNNVFLKCSWLTLVTPVLLIPVLWQRKLYLNEPLRVDGDKALISDTYNAFGFENFGNNFVDNIYVISGIDPSYGFSFVISFFSIIGVYLVLRKRIVEKNNINFDKKLMFAFLTITCALFVGIHFSYYWGNFTAHLSNRLALVFLPYIVIAAMYAIKCIEHKYEIQRYIIPTLCVFHMVLFLPYSKDQNKILGLTRVTEYNNVLKYLKRNYGDFQHENILVISDYSSDYFAQKYGSLTFKAANELKNELKEAHINYFTHVIILQKLVHPYKSPTMRERLDSDFNYHPVGFVKLPGLGITTRISELDSIE